MIMGLTTSLMYLDASTSFTGCGGMTDCLNAPLSNRVKRAIRPTSAISERAAWERPNATKVSHDNQLQQVLESFEIERIHLCRVLWTIRLLETDARHSKHSTDNPALPGSVRGLRTSLFSLFRGADVVAHLSPNCCGLNLQSVSRALCTDFSPESCDR